MSHSECISIIAAARVSVELPVASASFRISWVRRLVFNLKKQCDNLFADFIANFMVTGPGREFTKAHTLNQCNKKEEVVTDECVSHAI